jgi:hypothetical protein
MSHPARPYSFAFALLCLSLCLQAQPGKGRPGVVLYKDRLAAQWDTVKCVKNVIKINPLLFLRGEIPVYYERALSPRLSVELALGITYRNYLNFPVAGDDADDFSRGTEIVPKPSYHAGFRYYLVDDIEPQGTYLQMEFAHLDYSKDITMKDSTGKFTPNTLRDERIYNDVRLFFGYQRLGATSNLLIDVYGGVAFRSRDRTIVTETVDLTNDDWIYMVEQKRDNVPALFAGVKIGYGF